MIAKKDIMTSILDDNDEEFAGRNRELDCLIYRRDDGMKKIGKPDHKTGQEENSWKIEKGNVAVEVCQGKAKINVRVTPGTGPTISMKRIASIIVDAILEEMKKEG